MLRQFGLFVKFFNQFSLFFLFERMSEEQTSSSDGRIREYDEGEDIEMIEVSSLKGGEKVDQPEEVRNSSDPGPLNVVFLVNLYLRVATI